MKINIFIENPAGTTLKKEFNEKSESWSTVGHLAIPYPFPYGFIPKTRQKDGDPLDVFLLTKSTNVKRGSKLLGDVIGLAEYFEDNERDFKILVKSSDGDIKLSAEVKKSLQYFLEHAFDNQPGKIVKFGGFKGIKAAVLEIKSCYEN
jgi:inorganic pyrophosphatase